jgi:threonine synthase
MKYLSTRDRNHKVSAAQAIVAGLAPDGGLFLPESLPHFSLEEIEALSGLDYVGRATEVLSRFLTDFSKEELADYIAQAYRAAKFPPKAVAPLHALDEQTQVARAVPR